VNNFLLQDWQGMETTPKPRYVTKNVGYYFVLRYLIADAETVLRYAEYTH
jgi:hypothetical protein